MDLGYLLITLLCPLSMVAMIGWWAWSMRPSRTSSRRGGPVRSATDDAELTRLRAALGQHHEVQTQVTAR